VPKKVRKTALKMALSAKLQDESIVVLDQFGLEQPKTKAFAEIMANLDAPSALIVTDADDTNLDLASRNVQGVKVLRAEGLNVYDILKYKKLILLEPSIKAIEERFAS
jgi:large subunit ribosomal protein L4